MATVARPAFAPDHVPGDLLWDASLAEYCSQLDDPFLAAARLTEGAPLLYARDAVHGRPGWVIARHALLAEAFVDWESFSSEGGMDLTQALGVDWNLNPVNIDPPRHTRYRKVLTPFFTPKAVAHLEGTVRETCDRLIAGFADRGGCDFVTDFAVPFPTWIFLSLMGMPRDMAPQFFGWEQALLRGTTMEERIGAGRAILDYLRQHLAAQRAAPSTPLMEAIVTARIDDQLLDDGEILGMFYTFYVGGLDTVYATLSFAMRHIATRPVFQQFLRDNADQLPRAVDELIRMFSVVSTQRRVARDITFHGVDMRKDDLVVMPIFIACRDAAAYPDPHEAVLDRKTPMLSFASGPHTCLGMHLARREIRIAIASMLDRFANIRIPAGAEVRWHAGPTFNLDSLPLVWG